MIKLIRRELPIMDMKSAKNYHTIQLKAPSLLGLSSFSHKEVGLSKKEKLTSIG